ncbi:MAG: hypothetical protein H0U49_09075 [Parachlamydiaceae bacterium]|nr:hypothetical protein [Parachlamydiaceae bacterium]
MFKWLRQYQSASRQTKYFILTWFIFGICIVVTTIYCYARLEFARNHKTETVSSLKK